MNVGGAMNVAGALSVADQIQISYGVLPTLTSNSIGYTTSYSLSIAGTTYPVGANAFDIKVGIGTWLIQGFVRTTTHQNANSYIEFEKDGTSIGIMGAPLNSFSQSWMGPFCTTTVISSSSANIRMTMWLGVASQLNIASMFKATRIA